MKVEARMGSEGTNDRWNDGKAGLEVSCFRGQTGVGMRGKLRRGGPELETSQHRMSGISWEGSLA